MGMTLTYSTGKPARTRALNWLFDNGEAVFVYRGYDKISSNCEIEYSTLTDLARRGDVWQEGAKERHPKKDAEERTIKFVLDPHVRRSITWVRETPANEKAAVALREILPFQDRDVRDEIERAVALLTAKSVGEDKLRLALEAQMHWHEREDKALSKSGREDLDYQWRRLQHREQIAAVKEALGQEA